MPFFLSAWGHLFSYFLSSPPLYTFVPYSFCSGSALVSFFVLSHFFKQSPTSPVFFPGLLWQGLTTRPPPTGIDDFLSTTSATWMVIFSLSRLRPHLRRSLLLLSVPLYFVIPGIVTDPKFVPSCFIFHFPTEVQPLVADSGNASVRISRPFSAVLLIYPIPSGTVATKFLGCQRRMRS